MLGEGSTYCINGSFGSPEKNFSFNFSKGRTKFCFRLHYNGNNSYWLINGKEIKIHSKNVNFPIQFCLGSISNGFW